MKAAIVAGVPSPRFEPKASLLMGCINKISPEATDLTRRLLNRDPQGRPTAEEALEHIWINAREGRPQLLRPMLHSAKRAGAFDTRSVPFSGQSDIDRFMAHQQVKYHKTLVNAQKRRGSTACTATLSDVSTSATNSSSDTTCSVTSQGLARVEKVLRGPLVLRGAFDAARALGPGVPVDCTSEGCMECADGDGLCGGPLKR
jgi:serine/threonine protein kinase